MKKLFFPVAGMVVTLALGATTAGAKGGADADKTIVTSTVTLNYDEDPYDPYNPYGQSGTFSGVVTASGGTDQQNQKCERRRTVLIKNSASRNVVAYDTTNTSGQYSADALSQYLEDGSYFAKVLKKRKVRAEIKCRGAKSDPITIPADNDS